MVRPVLKECRFIIMSENINAEASNSGNTVIYFDAPRFGASDPAADMVVDSCYKPAPSCAL